jgi:hypothetical protein
VALAVLGVAPAAPTARAQTCAADDALGAGAPLAAPGPADFGQTPEACPASNDLGLRVRGELLIDTDDFYGTVAAGATLRGRFQLGRRWFFSAAIDPATWRFAANAVVDSSAVGVGPATLAAHRLFAWPGDTAAALYARLLLPLDSARHQSTLAGSELGASAARRLRLPIALQGGLSLPMTLAFVGGRTHPRLVPQALAEVAWGPYGWVAFAAGAALRTEVHPDAELAALAGRLSARFLLARQWRLGLAADLPVAGRDRLDTTVTLFAVWAPPALQPAVSY